MAKRLVKIAKELNVGTTTIVEHLTVKGYEVENKPTAKITDEMYDELLKEFQKSIAIKEQADQLVIGNRPVAKGAPEEKIVEEVPIPTPPPAKEEPQPVQKVVETPLASEPKEEVKEETKEAPRLKVLGKIDLGSRLKSRQEKSKPEPKQESPKQEAPKAVKKEAESESVAEEKPSPTPASEKEKEPVQEVKSETTPAPAKEEAPKVEAKKEEAPKVVEEPPKAKAKVEEKKVAAPKVVGKAEEPKSHNKKEKKAEPKPEKVLPAPEQKADPIKDTPVVESPLADSKEENSGPKEIPTKAPELRGLKIQGKIDIDKFKRPKKKKKTEADAKSNSQGDPNKPNSGNSDEPRKRRRRQRKKVSGEAGGNTNQGQRQGQDQRQGQGQGQDQRQGQRQGQGQGQGQNRGSQGRGTGQNRGPGGRGPGQNRGPGGRRNDRRGNRPDSRRRQPDQPQEVSQKEIEEKIKATMARLQGGGKKKRQKIRRDNRERQRERQEMIQQEQIQNEKLQLTEFVSVQELANLMDVPVTDVIMTCMNLGVIVSINQRLDAEIIELVAEEFSHEIEFISADEQTEEEEEIIDDPEDLRPRAPIVTVMGHVDHGKTSLLDYIRSATVAEGEAGGITQHIGAYEIAVGPDEKRITFLDTPGHEAFTAMRARGAKVTDIAIIIIAADDNVMPQTKEAISHAQAAGVPMIFAINKVDKPGAQPDRILQELANMNLLVESWGGQYQSQNISAKTGEGIEELLEKVLLEAELLELKANPDRASLGAVIEASLDKGRGYVTKMLVQNGTLTIGAPVVAGEHSGKVKAMFNENGKRIDKAGPSTPVLVLGLSGAPQAGERFKEVESDQEARQLAAKRGQISREQTNRATKRISLDEIGRRLALGSFKELNLIVKGDVDGSVEALSDSLIKQSIESVQVNVIHQAVGQIIESDVLLASASDAIIIGFQVRPSLGARKLAEREGVEIKMYSIIYEAIEEIRSAIEGLLEPTKEEKITSQVVVRETYKISKVGTIAGCFVQEGKINRNSKIRLIRNGIVVFPIKEGSVGEIASLKRFKDDVKEVKNGMECGISVKNFNDIKVGDVIESYEIIEIKQTLD